MIIDSGIVTGSLQVSGSFSVQGSTILSGGLNVAGGITGSISGSSATAVSASYATTAETAITAPYYVLTASYNNDSASFSTRTTKLESTASVLTSASASFASQLNNIVGVSGSYATTGSNTFNGNQGITGNVSITGSLTALSASFIYLSTIYETSSVVFSSGSNVLGDAQTDTQTLFGTINMTTGPVSITGSLGVSNGIIGNLIGTASYIEFAQTASLALTAQVANTASYVQNAQSASYVATAQTASYVANAQNAFTASYVNYAQSASFVEQAQNAYTASYALNVNPNATASYALKALNADNASTASYVSFAQTASLALTAQTSATASYVNFAQTASYVANAQSASYVQQAQNAYTASYVNFAQTASYIDFAQTASYVQQAQNAYTASYVLNAISASRATSALNADTASFVNFAQSASYVANAQSASYVLNAQTASYVENAQTASYVATAQTASYVNFAQSASYVANAQNAFTASYVQQAQSAISASYILSANVQGPFGPDSITNAVYSVTASYATSAPYYVLTASYSNDSSSFSTRTTNLESTASNLTSASSSFSTRTTNLESTASVLTSASASFAANYVQNSQTSSMTVLSASYAATASYALNVNPNATASYALKALNADTASYVQQAQNAYTASYVQNAQTASYVNPLNQNVQLTGSLTASANIWANKFVFTDGVVNTNNNGQLMFAAGGNYLYLYTGTNGLYINNQANNANNVIISDAGAVQTRGALTVGSPGNNQDIKFGGSDAKLDWAGTGAQIFYSAGALQFSSVGATNNMILQNGGGAIFNSGITGSLRATNGVISSSLQLAGAGFATTGSNTFTGTQYISDTTNATTFTSTAALYTDGGLRVTKDAYVSGTIYVNNITVYGTSSVQYTTSSQADFGTNLINVNTATPVVRFGGYSVYDSGSQGTQRSGSLLWDSQEDRWLYTTPVGSTEGYNSAILIAGPKNLGTLGNETGLTEGKIMVAVGDDHIGDAIMNQTASFVYVTGSLSATTLTGSLNGSNLIAGSVTNDRLTNSAITIAGTSTSLGGSITAATILSGTGVFSGSAQIPNTSITNAQLANSAVTVTAGTGLSGGGSVSLGSSVTLTNAGVTAFNTRTGGVTLAATDISGLGAGIFSGSAQIPAASITNAQLANSTISGVALGSNLATLTIGTGLSGTSYNGSGAVTIANTGVTSAVAGTAISVSGATGAVTITNTGVTSNVAGTGVSVSGATGAVTISIGQAVATSSNVQFNSLGVGTAGSAVAGEIRATADITAYYSSDERLKEDIAPIENPIEKLMAIDGVTFNWKEGFEGIHSHVGADTGVIAQQVEALELPGTVTTRETGYMAVNYEKLNALLIEGFKVQQVEINALKLELQEIKAKLK